MRSKYFSTEAIVLKRFNYGEADRILTLFTRDHGKISVIAKGVRKPSSRKRGHVELFNHIKAQVANGRGMGILTEAESVIKARPLKDEQEVHPQRPGLAASDLNRLAHAYQFAELIDRLLPEHEVNAEVFDLLKNALQSIRHPRNEFGAGSEFISGSTKILKQVQNDADLKNLSSFFKQRLIRILGFWPHEHTTPPDIDEYLDSILERPLNSRMLNNFI